MNIFLNKFLDNKMQYVRMQSWVETDNVGIDMTILKSITGSTTALSQGYINMYI